VNASSLLRLDKLTWIDAIDIAVVAVLLYFAFDAMRGTRAAQMLVGLALMFMAFELTGALEMRTIHKILEHAFRYIPFVIVVVFQAEIRRALTAVGRNPLLRLFSPTQASDDLLSEIVFAITTLSSQRTGGLIVLERSHRLKAYADSGIRLDAIVSYDLLVNIFNRETPLHDGAVIVADGRLAAASCFLPLTLQPSLSRQYGTRHRAAIGISEETDAVAIVVSEETGEVAVAVEGQITPGLWAEALLQHLRSLLGPTESPQPTEEKTHAAGT